MRRNVRLAAWLGGGALWAALSAIGLAVAGCQPGSSALKSAQPVAFENPGASEPHPMPVLAADAKSWPIFRGDSHSTGVARTTLPAKPELLWKFTVKDAGFETAPAIADGLVFAPDGQGTLHALDFATGEKKWEFKGSLGFVAPPSVKDGRVFLGDLDGNFYCVDGKTGGKIWQTAAEAEINSGANFYKDNVLFGSQDASLYCLKAATGDLVWKFTIEDQIRCTPTIVENRCFVAGCDGKLHIVDLDKGEAVAAVPIDSPTGTTPAVLGTRVYFGTHAGAFFCIDWKKAEVVWKFEARPSPAEYRSSAAVNEKYVVVGDRGRRLFALNPASGDQLWEFNSKKNIDGSPVIVGERAFIGTGDGLVMAFDLKTGDEAWSYEAGGNFLGSPAVAAGRLVIGNEDGTVYCFGAKKE